MKLLNGCSAGAVGILLLALVGACTASANVDANGHLTPPAGCSADASVQCSRGDGWSCAAGDDPEAEVSGLSCSNPVADGPNDDFCCYEFSAGGSSCTPDDGLTSVCQPGSYGYVCDAGDNPTLADSSLNCSAPTPDGSADDFCCQ
jgi:hypothetical protein